VVSLDNIFLQKYHIIHVTVIVANHICTITFAISIKVKNIRENIQKKYLYL
jgi:hypothetical protein